jgi:hypothetical protein
VIAHHPAGGKAQLEGYKVFLRHISQMRTAGVPIRIAREAVKNEYHVLDVQHHPENYDQTPSAAKKLGLPLMSIHSPCDKIGRRALDHEIKGLGRESTVGELVSRLESLRGQRPGFKSDWLRPRAKLAM